MSREIHLELLLGKRVRDISGRAAGRIEEVLADRVDLDCIVREFHLGSGALLERLSSPILRVLGRRPKGRRVPWDKLDLTDPDHPRLTCGRDELPPL
jgi:hypothetical protein